LTNCQKIVVLQNRLSLFIYCNICILTNTEKFIHELWMLYFTKKYQISYSFITYFYILFFESFGPRDYIFIQIISKILHVCLHEKASLQGNGGKLWVMKIFLDVTLKIYMFNNKMWILKPLLYVFFSLIFISHFIKCLQCI